MLLIYNYINNKLKNRISSFENNISYRTMYVNNIFQVKSYTINCSKKHVVVIAVR